MLGKQKFFREIVRFQVAKFAGIRPILLALGRRQARVPAHPSSFGVIHDTIKQRLRTSLLGSASGKRVLDTAAYLAGGLNEAGFWNELDALGSNDFDPLRHRHLARTMLLAKAQHLAPGELGGATRLALDWWLSHDFRSADWYQDQVIIPRLVGEIALLCEDDLSLGAWGRIIETLTRSRWSRWSPGVGWMDWSGPPVLGVAYNVILRGCLENAPALCDGAFRRAFRHAHWFSSDQEAIQATGLADGAPPSIGNVASIRDYTRLITLAYGTPWQAPVESVKAFVAYLLDFQQWLMWRDLPDGETSVAQDLQGLGASIAQLAQLGNPPRRTELANMAERLGGRGEPLHGHRHFWRSLLTVHQRPGFYCSLALHTPDPAEFVALTRQREAYVDDPCFLRTGRGCTGLAAQADVSLPETSAANPEIIIFNRAETPLAETISTVGGVGDGEYGLAVSGLSIGGSAGNKAWFFFDHSVVCLETGNHGQSTGTPAFSRINRCRLDGSVTAVSGPGTSRRQLAPSQRHHLSGVHRIEHGSFLYYFPDAPPLVVNLEAATGREHSTATGGEGLFTVGIDHGKPPGNAASVCLVLPLDDGPSRTRPEAEINQIDVLANDRARQAVRHRGLGIISVAFWEPSVLALLGGGRIAANSPCLLLYRDDPGGSKSVSVSNLLKRAAIVHVECHGRCVCFELPGGAEAGRSFSRRL